MYRWGTSPFHLRGVAYRDSVARAERMLAPRGLRVADVLRQHGDPALEAFVGQRFSATDWYDIYPAVHFAPIIAKACGSTLLQHMRDSAIVHANMALRGFTAVLLKLVSNEAVASWIPRMSTWYHDFGSIETMTAGERHVRGVRSGVPIFAVQGWSILAMHFTEHILAHAGAKDPRVHLLDAEPDGARAGCPTYRVRFEVRWV
jgi:hypothetical protein